MSCGCVHRYIVRSTDIRAGTCSAASWHGSARQSCAGIFPDAGVIVPDVSFSTVRSMISRWETGITSVKAEIPEELRAFDRELYRFTVNYYRDKYGEDAFYLPSEDRRHSFSDMSFEDQISYLTAHGVTFPDGYVDKYYTLIILAVENIERYPDSYGIALSAPQHMTVMRQMHDSINGYYGN